MDNQSNPTVLRDFTNLLQDAAQETGVALKGGAAEVAMYAAERSAHLATLVDDPNFYKALRAETEAVAMHGGINLVNLADAADAKIVGVIQGGLAMASRLLA